MRILHSIFLYHYTHITSKWSRITHKHIMHYFNLYSTPYTITCTSPSTPFRSYIPSSRTSPPTHAQRRYTLLCLLTPPKTRMRLPLRKVSCWRFLRRTWTDGGRSGESIVLRVAIVHICVHCTTILCHYYTCTHACGSFTR